MKQQIPSRPFCLAHKALWLRVCALAIVALVVRSPAEGALPPAYGGILRVPAPAPVPSLDPAASHTPFAAALAAAICDPLYTIGRDGSVRPLLADGLPEVEGSLARLRLRPNLRRHSGTPLTAGSVASSLRRAARTDRASWLLAAVARDGGEPIIRPVGPDVVELQLSEATVDIARILSAAPLAIATGRDRARRPLGSGPFSARLSTTGEIRLRAFRHAASGAPHLAEIRVSQPPPREDSLRAFELGRLDFSWHGESLYGGRPARPVSSVHTPATAPVLLVPNRRNGPLVRAETWAYLAGAIDRNRLRRVGIAPARVLAARVPAPRFGNARRPARRTTLEMPVISNDPFQTALAEALAGLLDEAGFSLRVNRMSEERYAAQVASRSYDLRIATVLAPLPGPGPLVGAALAEAGQGELAAGLVRSGGLTRSSEAARLAPRLQALVLGHRAAELHHRADLAGVGFDTLGRLSFGRMSLPREAP